MGAISTPCIKLCVLDDETGLCEGCGRTRRELAGWSTYSEAERLRIMGTLDGRLAALRDHRRQSERQEAG